MGICQCLMNQHQETQSNVPVELPDLKDIASNRISNFKEPNNQKHVPLIVTDFVQLPTKKNKDDNDISEFIKKTNYSPPTKKQDRIQIGIHGTSEVGKTSFLLRFCQNRFETFYIPSFPNETMSKVYIFNSIKYNLCFSINADIKRENDFDLIFFDLTILSSFNHLNNILDANRNKMKKIFLIGNKADLRTRKVDSKMLEAITSKYNCEYFDISVKENKGISAMINRLVSIFAEDSKRTQS